MSERPPNLLDEALGLDGLERMTTTKPPSWPLSGRVVAIEDCVETSGSFVLHHLIKRALSSNSSNTIVFLAFAQPFSHYDRVLRKLGCNLVMQRDSDRFFFFDMLTLQCPDGDEGQTGESGLFALYGKVQQFIRGLSDEKKNFLSIMIDDLSLMEATANGSTDYVLNFLHYCHTLTSEFKCSLITLNHEDIYLCMERPMFKLHVEYLSDVLIKAEPLATGLAADVHGQLTVLNNRNSPGQGSLMRRLSNCHFRVKENSVEYFYPGSQT